MQRFRLFVTSAERTQYAQELVDHMERVEQTYKQTRHLIYRIRHSAQPNKAHRNEDILVPADDESNERLRYAAALKELMDGSFKENAALSAYLKSMADAHEELEKHHLKFLRQVQTFSIKELRKFMEKTYAKIKQSYTDLEYRRDAYDLARHKLKSCKPEEIEQRGEAAAVAQKEFEQQALVLHEQLLKMPDYQMSIAKAAYMYLRSETDLARQLTELFKKIPSPERKSGSPESKSTVSATKTTKTAKAV